jgi:hypothetical protein
MVSGVPEGPGNPITTGELIVAGTQYGPKGQRGFNDPAAFAVSARVKSSPGDSSWSRGRGELLISPGTVVFEPSVDTIKHTGSRALAHTDPSITITRVWLSSPWASTFVLVHDRDRYVRVGTRLFARHRLRRALRDSGLTVREDSAWRTPPLADGRTAALTG